MHQTITHKTKKTQNSFLAIMAISVMPWIMDTQEWTVGNVMMAILVTAWTMAILTQVQVGTMTTDILVMDMIMGYILQLLKF